MGMTIKVQGMSCQHCVANVKKALEAVQGVVQASPDLASGKVIIEGENLDNDSIRKAITDAGYVPE